MIVKEFEVLYQDLFRRVFHYVYLLSHDYSLAEDITQDTFVKAYEYMIAYGKVLNKTWLYTVARNQYISTMRKRKFLHLIKEKDRSEDDIEGILDPRDTPEEYVLKKEQSALVHEVLKQLNESYRTALILREYHDLELDQITDILGVKRSYGKQLLYKAREKFKTIYQEQIKLQGEVK